MLKPVFFLFSSIFHPFYIFIVYDWYRWSWDNWTIDCWSMIWFQLSELGGSCFTGGPETAKLIKCMYSDVTRWRNSLKISSVMRIKKRIVKTVTSSLVISCTTFIMNTMDRGLGCDSDYWGVGSVFSQTWSGREERWVPATIMTTRGWDCSYLKVNMNMSDPTQRSILSSK